MTNTMQYVLPRLLTGIFVALFHAWPFILLNDPLVGEGKDPKKPKYPPLLRSAHPLGMILTILLLGLLSGSSHEIQRIFLDFFLLFLTLSLYYALVLLLMPFFRRRISARACAFLWTIPNILCIYFFSSFLFLFRSPKLVIPVSPKVLQSLSLIWFIGFAIVAVYKIGAGCSAAPYRRRTRSFWPHGKQPCRHRVPKKRPIIWVYARLFKRRFPWGCFAMSHGWCCLKKTIPAKNWL